MASGQPGERANKGRSPLQETGQNPSHTLDLPPAPTPPLPSPSRGGTRTSQPQRRSGAGGLLPIRGGRAGGLRQLWVPGNKYPGQQGEEARRHWPHARFCLSWAERHGRVCSAWAPLSLAMVKFVLPFLFPFPPLVPVVTPFTMPSPLHFFLTFLFLLAIPFFSSFAKFSFFFSFCLFSIAHTHAHTHFVFP